MLDDVPQGAANGLAAFFFDMADQARGTADNGQAAHQAGAALVNDNSGAEDRWSLIPVRDVIRNPYHPYTQGLIDALPQLDDLDKPLTPVPGDIPSPLERPEGCVFHTRCGKIVGDICRTTPPDWAQTGENHRTACYLCHEGQHA